MTREQIKGLREWARTVAVDLLLKRIKGTGASVDNPDIKLARFLEGRTGSYHLRGALETVRATS